MWFLPAHAGRMGDSPLSPTPNTRHNLRTRASAQAEQRAKRYHTSAENPWLQPGYVLPGVRPDFDLTAARAPSPSSASANLGPILDGLGGPDFAGPLLDAADANARARLARARLFLLRLLHNAQRNSNATGGDGDGVHGSRRAALRALWETLAQQEASWSWAICQTCRYCRRGLL